MLSLCSPQGGCRCMPPSADYQRLDWTGRERACESTKTGSNISLPSLCSRSDLFCAQRPASYNRSAVRTRDDTTNQQSLHDIAARCLSPCLAPRPPPACVRPLQAPLLRLLAQSRRRCKQRFLASIRLLPLLPCPRPVHSPPVCFSGGVHGIRARILCLTRNQDAQRPTSRPAATARQTVHGTSALD